LLIVFVLGFSVLGARDGLISFLAKFVEFLERSVSEIIAVASLTYVFDFIHWGIVSHCGTVRV
jgi:hypothetical protein